MNLPLIILGSVKNNVIWRASRILSKRDRFKAASIFAVQAFLGLLDVAAVMAIGVVGSLAVSGVASNQPGERIGTVLRILSLDDVSIQIQVAVIGSLAAVILVFKSLTSLFLTRKVLFFLSRRSALISQTLIVRLLGDSILKVRAKTVQETIYALTGGVQVVTVSILGAVIILLSDIFLLIFFTAGLFFVDTIVAVSSLTLFSSLGVILYVKMHKKAQRLGERATSLGIQSSDKISEVVSCYRELLVKGKRRYYAEKIGSMRLEMAEAGANLSVMQLLSKYIMEISMVAGGLFIGVTQFLLQPATTAVGVIGIFLVASARIVPAVLRIQTGLVGLKMNIGTATITLDLIEQYVDVASALHAEGRPDEVSLDFHHTGFKGNIKLRDLNFVYPGRQKSAIKGMNLNIREGEFLAIVGPSGAGKTTLVDLMIGVLKPNSGEVLISGLSPENTIRDWPGAIAYVPQDANIVNGSFKDNVCLGFDSNLVDDFTVEKILFDVQLGEVLTTNKGIHSGVGERGSLLSGGQRQRLGIARALFTQPRILILDESTSSLDADTESRVSNYLLSLKGKLTLIVIAHRLSTVRHADRIVYLKAGKARGEGSFQTLRKLVPDFDKQAKAMGL